MYVEMHFTHKVIEHPGWNLRDVELDRGLEIITLL